jgi:nicotinamidase-related amidase
VEKNNVPKKLNDLIHAARASGIPLIHSPIELDYLAMVDFKPLSAIQQVVLDNKLLAKGTRGSEFLAGLDIKSKDSVLQPRQGFSSFWAKTIQGELERFGARTIYIAGMLAEACVESHARDAVKTATGRSSFPTPSGRSAPDCWKPPSRPSRCTPRHYSLPSRRSLPGDGKSLPMNIRP